MKKTMVMAGILFALTMTAGCGNQNQENTAMTETQTQDVKLAEVTPEAFSDADVVFLGYPIWWAKQPGR